MGVRQKFNERNANSGALFSYMNLIKERVLKIVVEYISIKWVLRLPKRD